MLPLLLIYLLHAFYRTQGKGKGIRLFLPFYPFTFLPLTVLKAKERGIRLFLPFYPFTFLPLTVLKAKEKGIRFFLPFYLFTFINSLAAYPQSSAATSLPALPGAHACIRLALPG